jgi:hypothetical protein
MTLDWDRRERAIERGETTRPESVGTTGLPPDSLEHRLESGRRMDNAYARATHA